MGYITGTSKYIIHIEKIPIINLPFSQTHIVNLAGHCHKKKKCHFEVVIYSFGTTFGDISYRIHFLVFIYSRNTFENKWSYPSIVFN